MIVYTVFIKYLTMKHFWFMSWALGALLLLSSCGNGTSNKESEEDTTATESLDFAKGLISAG